MQCDFERSHRCFGFFGLEDASETLATGVPSLSPEPPPPPPQRSGGRGCGGYWRRSATRRPAPGSRPEPRPGLSCFLNKYHLLQFFSVAHDVAQICFRASLHTSYLTKIERCPDQLSIVRDYKNRQSKPKSGEPGLIGTKGLVPTVPE